MLQLPVPGLAPGAPLRVLALGCHSDDIEIGCGGTLLALKESGHPLHVRWVVFCTLGERRAEARQSAEELLEGVARAPRSSCTTSATASCPTRARRRRRRSRRPRTSRPT